MSKKINDEKYSTATYSTETNIAKRRLLAKIGLTAATGSVVLPNSWIEPVIRFVSIPVHAATSEMTCSATLEGEGLNIGVEYPDNTQDLQSGINNISSFFTSFYPDLWGSGNHDDDGRLGFPAPVVTIPADQPVSLTTVLNGPNFSLSNGAQAVNAVGGVATFDKVFLQNSANIDSITGSHNVTMTFSSEGFADCVITVNFPGPA